MMIKSMLPQCGSTCPDSTCLAAAALARHGAYLQRRLPLSFSLSRRALALMCVGIGHEASVACQRVWMLQMSFSRPLSLSPLYLTTPRIAHLAGSLRGRQFQVSCPFAVQRASERARICWQRHRRRCRFNLRLCNLPQQQAPCRAIVRSIVVPHLSVARCQGATVFRSE